MHMHTAYLQKEVHKDGHGGGKPSLCGEGSQNSGHCWADLVVNVFFGFLR